MAVKSLSTSRESHRRSRAKQAKVVSLLRDQIRFSETSFGWYKDRYIFMWLKALAVDPGKCKAPPHAFQQLWTQSLQQRELLGLSIDISTEVLDQFQGGRVKDGKSGSSMSKRGKGRGRGRALPSEFIARTSSPRCAQRVLGFSVVGPHLSSTNDSGNRVAQRIKGMGTEEEGNASDSVPLGDLVTQRNGGVGTEEDGNVSGRADSVPPGGSVAQRNSAVEGNPGDRADISNYIEDQLVQRRTITLKLIGINEPVNCAYTWLRGEAGDEVPFNDGIRSWVIEGGDRIQVIQFQQGGEPVKICDPIPNARGFWQAAEPYISQAVVAVLLYWSVWTVLYYTMTDPLYTQYLQDSKNRTNGTNGTNGTVPVSVLEGVEEFDLVNSTYLLAVTLSSTGYGEVHPQEWSAYAKVFISVLMLVGCGHVAGQLSALVSFVSTALGRFIFGSLGRCLGQPMQGSRRVKWSVGVAIFVVISCIGFGAAVVREKRGLLDSVYFSVSTLTTVGYGDLFYSSRRGKKFASVWLPLGTTFVALAFGHLSTVGYESIPSNMLFVLDAHI